MSVDPAASYELKAIDLLPDYLPDVLTYDPSLPPGFPSGRRLTDETADLLASLLTRGRVTSDLVGPHTDLLDEFPYLGAPHPTLRRRVTDVGT